MRDDESSPYESETAMVQDAEGTSGGELSEGAADGVELYRDPGGEDLDGRTQHESPDAGADEAAPSSGARGGRRRSAPRVFAVSGAKGGVGKTLLATNLALYLATIGRRVIAVDADAQGANIHTFLGIDRPGGVVPYVPPSPSFEPALPEEEGADEAGNEDELGQLVETEVPGLQLLRLGLDEPSPSGKPRVRYSRLPQRLRELDADHVVIDAGSGTHRPVLDFWLAADLSVFVTVPEPTAIENTYRFIRCAFARHLRHDAPGPDARRALATKLRTFDNAPAPVDFARRLEADDDPLAPVARSAIESFSFRMVLNQTRLRADLELGDRMRSAARRRLGVRLDYLGYVDYDDTAWSSVRARRPLLVESPGTKSSRNLEKIARRLIGIDAGKGPPPPLRTVPPETHHDLLEVDRGATDEEIRRAYKRAKEVYAPDALCCYGLFDAQGLEALRARLDEAYEVLLDPARRRPYELSVFPPETETDEEPGPTPTSQEPRPAPPVITPDTEFTGNLIRAVRESQGIDVRDISRRTKIGTSYLLAIEEERFAHLPAPVYVRGFAAEMAKYLKLDPDQVARTYVRRYQRHLEERGEV